MTIHCLPPIVAIHNENWFERPLPDRCHETVRRARDMQSVGPTDFTQFFWRFRPCSHSFSGAIPRPIICKVLDRLSCNITYLTGLHDGIY